MGDLAAEPAVEDARRCDFIHHFAASCVAEAEQPQLVVRFGGGLGFVDKEDGARLLVGECLREVAGEPVHVVGAVGRNGQADDVDADVLPFDEAFDGGDIFAGPFAMHDVEGQRDFDLWIGDCDADAGASHVERGGDLAAAIHDNSALATRSRCVHSPGLLGPVSEDLRMTAPVVIYRTRICPYCVMAARFFDGRGVAYEEIYLDGKPRERADLMARTNFRTVPQIFIGEQFVGGYDDVARLDRQGKLQALLDGAPAQ